MELWCSYLRMRIKPIVAFAATGLIFLFTLALYRLPPEPGLYALAVCAFFGTIILAVDFRSFLRQHKALRKVLSDILVTTEPLPAPQRLLEDEYQAIVYNLGEAKMVAESEGQKRYAEMMEYYTVWAHQIKTPISAMYLRLQGEDSALSRQLTEELGKIEQYVEMVLWYLRLDAEGTDYLIREYDLDTIIKQAVRRFAPQFIYRKIALVYEPVEFRVLTDEKQLLFVLEQLLANALKYTKEGGRISIAMEEAGVLCITDSGIGIAPEDLPRIFERGYTGLNGRRDKKASGIGLYLCKRICDNLGHHIKVASVPDHGTAISLGLKKSALEIE